jgi:hypothetical protein
LSDSNQLTIFSRGSWLATAAEKTWFHQACFTEDEVSLCRAS